MDRLEAEQKILPKCLPKAIEKSCRLFCVKFLGEI